MADRNSTLQNDFTIRISKTLAFEFSRRDVFPELRPIKAKKLIGATHLFTTTINLAEEIHKYANDLYEENNISRGLKTALNSLRRQLKASIWEYKTKGLIKDPGLECARKLISDSPSVFHVGDYCYYIEEDGELLEVEVMRGYSLYRISCDDGQFYDDEGRLNYLYGYGIKAWGGEICFSPPHLLLDMDLNRKHIQLVNKRVKPFSSNQLNVCGL